jgi:hypothetical protein
VLAILTPIPLSPIFAPSTSLSNLNITYRISFQNHYRDAEYIPYVKLALFVLIDAEISWEIGV